MASRCSWCWSHKASSRFAHVRLGRTVLSHIWRVVGLCNWGLPIEWGAERFSHWLPIGALESSPWVSGRGLSVGPADRVVLIIASVRRSIRRMYQWMDCTSLQPQSTAIDNGSERSIWGVVVCRAPKPSKDCNIIVTPGCTYCGNTLVFPQRDT